MVPSHYGFGTPGLLEHVHHFGLENGVDGFDGDTGSGLRHGEDLERGGELESTGGGTEELLTSTTRTV